MRKHVQVMVPLPRAALCSLTLVVRSVALCARTSWSDLYEEAAVDKCRFCDAGAREQLAAVSRQHFVNFDDSF